MNTRPVDAIVIDAATGAKVIREAACVGCKVCAIACPFGTVNYMANVGRARKCDLCGGDPECVTACPTATIAYIDADWTGLDRMRAWAATVDTAAVAAQGGKMVGWNRNVLRVNLTAGTCTPEPLNMSVATDCRWLRRGGCFPGAGTGYG